MMTCKNTAYIKLAKRQRLLCEWY